MNRRLIFLSFLFFISLPFVPASASEDPLFEEISKECGLADARGGKFSFGDFDNDCDPDLLINGRKLFRNDGSKGKIAFLDITAEAGLNEAGGDGACWFDFDRDGWLDFVTNSGDVFISNEGKSFVNRGKRLGIEIPNSRASCIGCGDFNGDGWIDIFTGGGENWKEHKIFRQTLWLNKGGKGLIDVTGKAGLDQIRYGRAAIWCDYDWDGDQDIYSGNYRLHPNILLCNDRGKLVDVSEKAGATGRYDQEMFVDPHSGKKRGYRYGHTIAASWADLNNDGFFDLWVSNLAHKAIGKVSPEFAKVLGSDYDSRGYDCDDSNIYINSGPPEYTFEDRRVEMGIPIIPVQKYGKWKGDELWSGAACADFDNNGWIDVYVNQVYGNQPNSFALLFANDGGMFEECGGRQLIRLWGGYGSAWADVDSDGNPDLVATGAPKCNGKSGVHFFHNKGSGSGWIGFDLKGTKKAQTIGARVLLLQEGNAQLRLVSTSMGSHTQQNEQRLHFGLGKYGPPLAAIAYWPDGTVQSIKSIDQGQYHYV